MSFNKSSVSAILARADIKEIIGKYINLKRRSRNRNDEYIAICPFHSEKTPSFTVTTTKQFYHCFGCGAHGDVAGFLVMYCYMSRPEALVKVAELSHYQLPAGCIGVPSKKKLSDRKKYAKKCLRLWRIKDKRDRPMNISVSF